MTGKAEFFRCLVQQARLITGMRVVARGAVVPARRDMGENGLPGLRDLLLVAVSAETLLDLKRILRVSRRVAIGAISLHEGKVPSSPEETGLGRGVRIVTSAAIGLDHGIVLVGGLELGVLFVTRHAVAAAGTLGEVSKRRGMRLVTGGALVATKR